jgi:hypothetical protein
MTDKNEPRRCAVCGGPVGPGGQSLTPVPTREVSAPKPKTPPKPTRHIEDVKDDLTPVQRFERALRRRDAVMSKPQKRSGKKDDKAR